MDVRGGKEMEMEMEMEIEKQDESYRMEGVSILTKDS